MPSFLYKLTLFKCNKKKKCVVAISDIYIATLVSGGLLSLAEQKPAVSEKISTTDNMVFFLTRDRIIKVL